MMEMNGNGQKIQKPISQQNYEELTKLLSSLIDKQNLTDSDYKTLVTVLETDSSQTRKSRKSTQQKRQTPSSKTGASSRQFKLQINELNDNYRLIWKAAQYEKQHRRGRG